MQLDFGIGLITQDPPNEFMKLVKNLESWGLNTIWIPDQDLFRDCYVNLALCALNTTKIKLGTAVTNPVTRHPAITAEAIATIDEISNGRAVLGMGLGGNVRKMLKLNSSISICREAVSIMRRFWAGEKFSFEGKHFGIQEAELCFKTRTDIPIYISASGPRTLEMAGETADGAIVCVGTSKNSLKFALEHIYKGTEKAGKDFQDFYKVSWTAMAISEDIETAKEYAKGFAAWIIASTPILGKVAAIHEKDVKELTEAYLSMKERFRIRDVSEVKELVTDEMIDKFTIVGTPENCIKKIRSIARTGINQLALLPIGKNREATITAFANEVIPAFQE